MKLVNRTGVTAFGIVLLSMGALAADQKDSGAKAASSQTVGAAPVSDGVVVVKDQNTGELRPATPEEIGALSKSKANVATAQAAIAAPKVVVQPDGLVSVQLSPEQMVYSVVTKTADGKLVQSCVTGENAAKRTVLTVTSPRSASMGKWDDK